MRNFLLPILGLWLGTACLGRAEPVVVSASSAELFRTLGRGVNLGDALERAKGDTGGWKVEEKTFTRMEQGGFTTVRVPIRWSDYAAVEAPYAIDPEFFTRIDWVVAQAHLHHLNVILDDHHYLSLFDDPAAHEARFVALWRQIAEHYRQEPPSVLFELCNEPNQHLDAALWNRLLAEALAAVRATNPDRWVVVGPVQWNAIDRLPDLALPEADRRLVVTFHFYDPMSFTHQGAPWVDGSAAWLGNTWTGNDAQRREIEEKFNRAAAWGEAHRRPLLLGEFGSYGKGDMESRARWTACVARAAEARGIPWAYWEFGFGFGVYDPADDQWRQPLLQALIPGATP